MLIPHVAISSRLYFPSNFGPGFEQCASPFYPCLELSWETCEAVRVAAPTTLCMDCILLEGRSKTNGSSNNHYHTSRLVRTRPVFSETATKICSLPYILDVCATEEWHTLGYFWIRRHFPAMRQAPTLWSQDTVPICRPLDVI